MLAAADRTASLCISLSGPSTLTTASKSTRGDPLAYNAVAVVAATSDTGRAQTVQGRASSVSESSRVSTNTPRQPQRPRVDEFELEEGREREI